MKKILALVLAAMMLLALVPAASADVPADWAPFAENVTISVAVYDRSRKTTGPNGFSPTSATSTTSP